MFNQAIFFFDDDFCVDGFSIFFKTVATSFIFNIRVDVWIVPKNRWFDAFRAQVIYTIYAAWRAARVH